MRISSEVSEIINIAFSFARSARFEFVTPELLLYVVCQNKVFAQAFENCGGKVRELDYQLRAYFDNYMETLPAQCENTPALSQGMGDVLSYAWNSAQNSGRDTVELPHIIHAMYKLEESYAVYYMRVQGVEQADLLQEMTIAYETPDEVKGEAGENTQEGFWQEYATCLNDRLQDVNPLIGREDELERTIQILCRKDKNNPLHIGEPGVGKTAITYGLARLLNENRIPEPLQGAKIFSLDLGSLLAGTQYRGDFEKRFKKVMDSINREENPIVYIDEIHNIIGAGAVNGGTFDISNMLKPYLAAGHIRFIGATTYEEYKKHFEKNKSLVRRFQNIDIKEPGIQECVQILEGLKKNYEEFHGIRYEDGVLEYAVEMSAKYINERYLPDKAIDLIDEAGAYRRMHPIDQNSQSVDKELIDEILSKTCHIPKQMVESDETASLATLEERKTPCSAGRPS